MPRASWAALREGEEMTFTEVAFALAEPTHPLCRLTNGSTGGHAVYRVLDHKEAAQRHRAHVAYRGPPDAPAELVRELRAWGEVEVVHEEEGAVGLSVTAPYAPGPLAGPAAIAHVLQAHGIPAILDPIVAADGRLRVRLVFPRMAEAQEVLRMLQDMQRAGGFSELRIGRIAPLDPGAHVKMSRRALTAEQENLLALATAMGYYETPKLVTLEQIARTVGLSISPVHKKLKAAEETIVRQHVAHLAPEPARRRARPPAQVGARGPWEVQVRASGDLGAANVLTQFPQAISSLHLLPAHAARPASSLLVVVASDDVQRKLLSGIEDRPEVTEVSLVDRSGEHAAWRLSTREGGLYGFSWWGDAWGSEAALRTVVFERGEAHVRALVTHPTTPDKLEARLRDCARVGGWREWEVEALRDLAPGEPPAPWPEPLTQRQLEVLRVAYASGYYQTPRGCTLENIASTLGVSANAVHKNLVLAESKLISAYLAAGV